MDVVRPLVGAAVAVAAGACALRGPADEPDPARAPPCTRPEADVVQLGRPMQHHAPAAATFSDRRFDAVPDRARLRPAGHHRPAAAEQHHGVDLAAGDSWLVISTSADIELWSCAAGTLTGGPAASPTRLPLQPPTRASP